MRALRMYEEGHARPRNHSKQFYNIYDLLIYIWVKKQAEDFKV
jgi:hypothetical protein